MLVEIKVYWIDLCEQSNFMHFLLKICWGFNEHDIQDLSWKVEMNALGAATR